jgi:Response regulator containing CheY-like receiver, AAA-type ATPase, and DNA-binding domains
MVDMRPRGLVVEDDAVTRGLLAQLLNTLDFDVDLAVDGKEALACLTQNEYEVVVLDVVLPKVSGIEVMESLQRDRPRMLGRIIVVTGLDIREIRSLFPTVHETLSKPVQPARLREAVRTCVAQHSAGSARIDERITSG